MPDFGRALTGRAGYRVPLNDPSFKGVDAVSMQVLQYRLEAADTGGAAGGFKLDVEQMRTLLPQWKEMREKLREVMNRADDLLYVEPPAQDVASLAHNVAALDHAHQYALSSRAQFEYADGYVNSLQKMIEKYEHSDGSARDRFNITGADL